VRRKPYSVVLFDEIEKAHPDIFSILLQVLDDGVLTDSLGRKVDFRNTIIIMTSNVGARDIKNIGSFGFGGEKSEDQHTSMKNTLEDAMRKLFNPEFLNRIDEAIVFRNLEKSDILQIISIELQDLLKNIAEHKMEIVLDDSAKNFLVEQGFDQKFGARPLRRAIQKYVEDPLAEEILRGSFKEGAKIIAKHVEGTEELVFMDENMNLDITDEEEEKTDTGGEA
jgi:ATP-dependent Clp protease ATP-binding subunit ClpC